MALADTKRGQTAINLLYTRVTEPIQAANSVAGLIRQAVIDNGLTGQFSGPELAALQTFVTDLESLATSAVMTAIADRYRPHHTIEQGTIGLEI